MKRDNELSEEATETNQPTAATMTKKERERRLKAAGFQKTDVQSLLGLKDEEMELIETRVYLARAVKHHRVTRLKVSQTRFATMIGSSQSRVAKMEQGDRSVSLDLLVRSLLSTGVTRIEMGEWLASPEPA